jgi:sulfoxide reductase heme-binding subunit YedZ
MSTLLAATSNGKALWYLTRGTGTVALLLLTAGLVLGIAGPLRIGRPRFLVAGLHRNVTLLAVVFVAVHVITTVADAFAPIGLVDAVLPFHSPYRPVWLGLGAVAFDLLLALIVTSLLRARLGIATWRAVHWLAYASWPVALLHSLGTGSDAHAGWLQLLAGACTVAVAAAVIWRAAAARGEIWIRVAAGVGAVAIPIALLVWAESGPLARGWAARSGTPARLLPHTRTVTETVTTSATPISASLPSGSFAASLHGALHESRGQRGLVVVLIDATAKGSFTGRVHVALRGIPIDGGGVQMLDSTVGLLPTGAPAWLSGRVVGLDGQRILLDVQRPDGRTARVLLTLRIDGSGTVSGRLRGLS